MKRVLFNGKQEIAKYASTHGFATAAGKFKPKFPNLNESTVGIWVKKYKVNLKEKQKQGQISDFTPKSFLIRTTLLLVYKFLKKKFSTKQT